MAKFNIADIQETREAIIQRDRLREVRRFLIEYDAENDLIEAVDIAIEDMESWIHPEIEKACLLKDYNGPH
jgi:hypothetical protein